MYIIFIKTFHFCFVTTGGVQRTRFFSRSFKESNTYFISMNKACRWSYDMSFLWFSIVLFKVKFKLASGKNWYKDEMKSTNIISIKNIIFKKISWGYHFWSILLTRNLESQRFLAQTTSLLIYTYLTINKTF